MHCRLALPLTSGPPPRLAAVFCIFSWLAIVFYSPGQASGFKHDDFANLVDNSALVTADTTLQSLIDVAFSAEVSPLRRPVAMTSFWVEHVFFAGSSATLIRTNIFLHTLTAASVWLFGALVFASLDSGSQSNQLSERRVSPSWALALFPALVFLFHPYNVSTVLYAIQRMTILSTLFSIWALNFYLVARVCCAEASLGIKKVSFLSASAFSAGLALLSKETALSLLLVIPLIELTLVSTEKPNTLDKFSKTVCLSFPLIFFLGIFYSLGVTPDAIQNAFQGRAFDLSTRLWAECWIVLIYLKQSLIPNIFEMGLHQDNALTDYLSRPAWKNLGAGLSLLVMVALAVLMRRRLPGISFGLAFFLLCHLLESSIIPLELMYEHRNYFALSGLLIGLVYEVRRILRRSNYDLSTWKMFSIAGLFIFTCALLLHMRIQPWANPIEHLAAQSEKNADSVRNPWTLSGIYQRSYLLYGQTEDLEKALYWIDRSSDAEQHYQAAHLAAYALRLRTGRPVGQSTVDDLIEKLRSRPLSAESVSMLKFLNECWLTKKCETDGPDVQRIFSAALTNQQINTKHRRIVAHLALKNSFASGELPPSIEEQLWKIYNDERNDARFREPFAMFLGSQGRVNEALNVALGKEMVRSSD